MLITNSHIISPGLDLENAAIEISEGMISKIIPAGNSLPEADKTLDAGGKMLMPGFIDVHCHGRSGFDIADGTREAIYTIAKDKLSEGITSFIPATLTLPENELEQTLKILAEYSEDPEAVGTSIPGVHLEGPFINSNCLGAQNPDFVRNPDIDEVMRLNRIFPVLKVTYSPEVDGGIEFTRQLLESGITPSCGHSAAGYAAFKKAYDQGLRNLTHFCNQMTPLHHRDIGLVGAALLHDDVYTEIICDKIHLCPEMIDLIFKLRKTDKILLITDAMRAAGLPDGKSSLGGLDVIVSNGVARLASDGALAGSTLRLNQALKNVHEVTGKPLKDIVAATSLNQAESLGLTQRGRLEAGYRADMVILDDEFNVDKVFIAGNCVL